MKTKQEMISRSIYMPKNYWNEIDKIAEVEESSSNTVVRKLVSLWLTGCLKEVEKTENRRTRAKRG